MSDGSGDGHSPSGASDDDGDPGRYVLRLYVAGAALPSQRAIAALTRLCEELLAGRYRLEVIDVYQHPELAASEQVVATPTLLKVQPEPVARLVGDMTDRQAVLRGLQIGPAAPGRVDGNG